MKNTNPKDEDIVGSSVLIVGYGREGQCTHAYLKQHYPAVRIGIADVKPVQAIPESSPGTEFFSGPSYLDAISQFDTIIHSPGINVHSEQMSILLQGKHVTSATNLFFSKAKGTIIGVTGTKGKSTTSSLIAAMLSTCGTDIRYAGNIGYPMLQELNNHDAKTIFVLELSSFQLEDLRFSPHVAVYLNIVPEHIDHHGTFENYLAAKGNLCRHQSASDYLIFNPSHPVLCQFTTNSPARHIAFGVSGDSPSKVYFSDGRIFVDANELVALSEVKLMGPGNIQNMMAATATALTLGVPIENIRQTLIGFQPLAHRLEIVGEWHGIKFVNDSLATVPQALCHALQAFPDTAETLIAGGYDRGLDYSVVGQAIVDSKVKNLILFPETGEKIWKAFEAKRTPSSIITRYDASSMQEAIHLAYKHTTPGKACILAPGSASFNMFRDYRERGEAFKRLAKQLGEIN